MSSNLNRSTARATFGTAQGNNLGNGSGIYESASGNTLNFYSLSGVGGVTLITGSTTLTLSGSSTTLVDTKGVGQTLYINKSGNTLNFKSLVAGSGVTFDVTTNQITINSTASGSLANASNGLSIESSNTVILGGNLTKSTRINFGNYALSFGRSSACASACGALAINSDTNACGVNSFAQGNNTTASGIASHSEGYSTLATGTSTHAQGCSAKAFGNYSHSEGLGSIAYGIGSHAEGKQTKACGDGSHAEGNQTISSGLRSHAEGSLTQTLTSFSHAEGFNNCVVLGNFSHAEGSGTKTCASGSHTEGCNTTTCGTGSHAEGCGVITYGSFSHSEGILSESWGLGSHAEGLSTYACGNNSHSQGIRTVASGLGSFSSGIGDQTRLIISSGQGAFNHSYNTSGQTSGHGALAAHSTILGGRNHNIESGNTYAVIIGGDSIKLTGSTYSGTTAVSKLAIFDEPNNGGSDDLLTWNPVTKKVGKITQTFFTGGTDNYVSGGTITGGSTLVLNRTFGLSDVIIDLSSLDDIYLTGGTITGGTTLILNTSDGNSVNIDISSVKDGVVTGGTLTGGSTLVLSRSEGLSDIITNLSGLTANTLTQANNGLIKQGNIVSLGGELTGDTNINLNTFGLVLGSTGATATGSCAIALGYNTKANGDLSFVQGRYSAAYGLRSVAFGASTKAYGDNSFAQGNLTKACGDNSHAEGFSTISIGAYSHAEGLTTEAIGAGSHSEGRFTYASGNFSHAQGCKTKTLPTSTAAFSSGAGGSSGKDIIASGLVSFIHSHNTVSQIAGHGALGDYSAILGGRDHNIESGNTDAAIIGGNGIKLTGTTYTGTTAVGNLAIFETPAAGGSNDVLTWNPTTKKIEKVTQASLGGGGGISAAANGLTTDGTTIVLGGTLTGDTTVNTNNLYGVSIGYSNISNANNSFAINRCTRATGDNSFAHGFFTCAAGISSHAEGNSTRALGDYSHAEGNITRAYGISSHAEGCASKACSGSSHAEGYATTSSNIGSHSEGNNTLASGASSHAEGSITYAIGNSSHAEGCRTCAIGNSSHAEGYRTYSIGNFSHAEGCRTYAYGVASHTGGQGNITSKRIFACGCTSFNHSFNNNLQIAGHGANANFSAILGGCNHNIESGNTGAAIIGGNGIKLTGTTYTGTTAVGNLAIFDTPAAGGSDDVLTWDSGTSKVRKVTQASISDARLKTSLVKLNNTLSTVDQLNVYEYEFNDKIEPKSLLGQKRYGLIAQEVEKIYPHVVKDNLSINNELYKTIDYKELVPVLIKMVQELKEEINILKNKI